MRKSFVFKILLSLSLCLVLSLVSCNSGGNGSSGDSNGSSGNGDNNGGESTPAKDVAVITDGKSEYVVIYSSGVGGAGDAYEFCDDVIYANSGVELSFKADSSEETAKEILVGRTSRQLSLDLVSALEQLGDTDEYMLWGYACRGEQVALYWSNNIAKKWCLDEFRAFFSDGALVIKDDLWVVQSKSFVAYDEEEEAKAEAERLARIDAMKAEIKATTVDFGELPDFTVIYGNPTITPLYSHPRVWVNNDTLPTVIANLSVGDNAGSYAKLLSKAREEFDGKLMPLSNTDLLNFSTAKSSIIEALAFMYLTTGDEYYGYSAILAAKNYIKTAEVRGRRGEWNSDDAYTISNQSSVAMGVMAEVYDWCYDLLSKEDKDFIVKGTVNKFASWFEVACPPSNGGTVTGHSTGTQTLRDWPAFAIAVADEYPEIYNYIIGLVENYYTQAPNWYYRSGANFQGSAYGVNKTYLHMICELLVLTMSGEKLFADDVSFEATVYTYLSYLRPDEESLRIGDDYNQLGKSGYNRDIRMAVWGWLYYKNPEFKAWAKKLTSNFASIGFGGLLETTPLKILIFNDPTVATTADDLKGLPLVNYNGSPTGAIIARSAWNDPDAWMTYTNIGEAYGANHDHKDAGTFQIYYKGILAPDTGAYQYLAGEYDQGYGTNYDVAYVKQTISKNGLLIYNPNLSSNGKWLYSGGQTVQGNANSENGTLAAWLERETSRQALTLGHDYAYDDNGELIFAYISGDITNAYDKETVNLVTRSTISIATGNEAHPLLFIVYDRIESDDPGYKKTFLLHTTNEPVFDSSLGNVFYYTNTNGANGSNSVANSKYNGKLVNTTLLPAEPTYDVYGGDGERFWVNGQNRGEEGDTSAYPYTELGWGRVEISTVGNTVDSFLNVMYVGDANRTDAYVGSTLVQSETHEGAISFGSCVMFSKSPEAITEAMSFSTSGDRLNYYVTGLRAGKWEVSVNGQKVSDVTVKDGSGVAAFTADAGNVTLTPKFAVLSFELFGGEFPSEAGVPDSYTLGEKLSLSFTPEKFGSRFVGWYLSEDMTGAPITELPSTQTGDVKLYAKWEHGFDVITFNLAGGSMSHATTVKRQDLEGALPNDVTKDGCEFLGWYLTEGFSGTPVTTVAELPAGNVELYARYRITVPIAQSNSQTVSANIGYLSSFAVGDAIDSTPSKSLTMTIDLAAITEQGFIYPSNAHIRIRTSTGGSPVYPIHFKNGKVYACDATTEIADMASGPRIDIVMDFDDNTLTYYVNGELFGETFEGVTGFVEDGSGNHSNYNFTGSYAFAQFDQQPAWDGKIKLDGFKLFVGNIYE